jgi:surface protein
VNSVVAGGDIDLSAYVTKQELDDANFAYYKDFSDYVRLEQFNLSVSNLQNQIENIEPSVDVDLTSYVKKSELQANDYAYKADLNELKNDVIEDELVLAYAVHDIQTLNSYLTSYVKRSEYNELVNSYNKLYLTVTYLLQNVQWSTNSETPEQFTTGYIIGTTTEGFNTVGCEAFPSTYLSAPSFKVAVPNGRLAGSANHMFGNSRYIENSYLTSITSFDVDTSDVTNMGAMFMSCRALTSLDLSRFNTSQVTSMNLMFYLCTSLTSLDLSSFDTSRVTTMANMFQWCPYLKTLDISSFNTSQVTDMNRMFYGCHSLTSLDLSRFNTSQVTDMAIMFNGLHALTSLDLSSFDTSNVTNMYSMFRDCKNIKTLDISNFNIGSANNLDHMFYGCDKLSTVYVDNMSTNDIDTIKARLGADIGYVFVVSTLNGRKILTKTSSRVVNINL